MICRDSELARVELTYVIAYQALRESASTEVRNTMTSEANALVTTIVDKCDIPKIGNLNRTPSVREVSCIKSYFQSQHHQLVERTSGLAREEALLEPIETIAIQKALISKQFLSASATIDGVIGPASRSAILSWQRSEGLRETGYGSRTMLAQLRRSGSMAAAPRVNPAIGCIRRGELVSGTVTRETATHPNGTPMSALVLRLSESTCVALTAVLTDVTVVKNVRRIHLGTSNRELSVELGRMIEQPIQVKFHEIFAAHTAWHFGEVVSTDFSLVTTNKGTRAQFDDVEAQLRIKQAASTTAATASNVEALRKQLEAERQRVVVTDGERDLNRTAIKALEDELQSAEAEHRKQEAALSAAQDARTQGLAAEAERRKLEDNRRRLMEEAEKRKDEAQKKAAAGDFPAASCKGWNGTIVEKSGVDTVLAILKGVVTTADVQEYCERDPGGMRTGGKLTVEQCIAQIQQEIGRVEMISTANCDAGTLAFRYGTRTPQSVQFPMSTWADKSCASGMPPLIEQFKILCPTAASRLGR